MKETNAPLPKAQQPVIVKHVQSQHGGIQLHKLSRHAIGFVLKGRKYVYYGDLRYEISRGDIIYLSPGNHYTEDVPDTGKTFEQITFFYTPETLSDILSMLSLTYDFEITNDHSCANCEGKAHVRYPAWNTIKSFFSTVNQYIREDAFNGDPTVEKLKTTELIYLIVSNPDCCIKKMILDDIDLASDNFEQTVQRHIFDDVTIEELARLCHKSLTSFKKEFNKHFGEPPHKWIIRRRLVHSRLLLISTNKSISEVGNNCGFPNASHYIRLFRNEYGLTPSAFRTCSRATQPDAPSDTSMLPEIVPAQYDAFYQ